jgi:hypothetical protein
MTIVYLLDPSLHETSDLIVVTTLMKAGHRHLTRASSPERYVYRSETETQAVFDRNVMSCGY